MDYDKKQYKKNREANKYLKEKLSPTEQPKKEGRYDCVDQSLKLAFDQCIERGKKASEIKQDEAKKKKGIKGQLYFKT